jgi:deoxyadenosine/deoxycytidine kinase
MDIFIIHISGPSGSGKTTLGKLLKNKYKNKIVVKDLDDLRDDFIKEFYGNSKWTFINEIEYQKYIYNYINQQNKPIIFVGLNDNTIYGKNKKIYYNLQSTYNYYIKIDNTNLLKQKCIRLLNDIQTDKMAMEDLIKDNKSFIKKFTNAIKKECNLKHTIRQNKKWTLDYKNQNYKIMSRKNIYKSVVNILNYYI